tara:strand:+ start:881 stop:3079 length:2199 start_codon:yes stop_codon:yes gene_type:complete
LNIVEQEWTAREQNGLPPHHSIDINDVGFRFTKPQVKDPGFQSFLDNDFEKMEEYFEKETDVRSVVTLKDIPSYLNYDLFEVQTIILNPQVVNQTAFLCCDGKYFELFGAKLLASIEGPAHVHLMDADPSYAKKVIKELDRVVGLTVEQPQADPAYYHSVRFIRWYQFMKYNNCSSVLLDVDAIANRCHTVLPQSDVGLRLRPGRLEPWNVCNASVCIGTANPYWKAVADYIYYYWQKNKLIWQIDQAALWAVWQKQKTKINVLGPKHVDYDYQDDGIIWCNSGSNKFKEEDKTRSKFRDKFDKLQVATTDTQENIDQLEALHKAGKIALKELRMDEAKRLYMRLLRRSMEGLPSKPEYVPDPIVETRKVEKILYLPVEVAARELASREWLAQEMQHRGFKVVVGARWPMQTWSDLPPGIILWKSANTQDVGVYQEAVNAGHLIVLMDEELFPMQPRMDLYKPSVDQRCLDYADLICAHNDEQKKLFEKLTETPVAVTGNPRSLLYSKAVRGNRIIICTMAGTLNNYGRSFKEMVQGTVRLLGGVSPEVFDFLAYQIDHEINGYEWTRKAIQECAKLKPLIRCHPSEDISFWDGLGEIDDRTPFNERLADAKAIVYVSGCGTGLDATLSGVPSVRLGTGGHGLSALLGTAVTDKIKKHVVEATANKKPEFSLVTLPDVLDKLQQDHHFDCPFDIEKAYEHKTWTPTEFHTNKFPVDPKGHSIGWRTSLWNQL